MNAADISIRRATEVDLDRIAPLFEGYLEFYSQQPSAPGARHFIAERLRNGDSVIFAATATADEGAAAVGFAQLYPSFSSLAMRRIWVLNDLFVEPGARGRGVGRALLDRARTHALETGARRLTLATLLDNYGAQQLYESLGYLCDNSTTKFYTLELD